MLVSPTKLIYGPIMYSDSQYEKHFSNWNYNCYTSIYCVLGTVLRTLQMLTYSFLIT